MKQLLGNEQSRQLLQTFFDTLSQKETVPFLIVSGPEHVGKTTAIEEHIMKLLGLFVAQDYLPLYDCTQTLGKKHTLKVEVPTKDQSIETNEGRIVQNLGTRATNDRLSRSPAGDWKVLFLENIERMTTSAANALLKSLEEPLPNRLIIATTSNYKLLLDTIISRAMIVRFHPVGYDAVSTYCTQAFSSTAEPIRRFVIGYCAGCPGRATQLLSKPEGLSQMSELFNSCLRFYKEGGSTVEQYQRLQKRQKEFGSIVELLDGLLYSLNPTEESNATDQLLTGKKLLQTNVSVDTILFSLSVDAKHLHDTIT